MTASTHRIFKRTVTRVKIVIAPADPVEAAKAAQLRYVDDTGAGVRRLKLKHGFRYVDEAGKAVHDRETLTRIKALVIPPAWVDVWICARPNGHLQATGRDARGRKQYRYHPRWREVRDGTKYHHLIAFATALPSLRMAVEHHLALPGLPREKVLAAVVRLLETTHIRIGNEEYARTNRSFGLTTLQDRHVEVVGTTLNFRFRGKSGVKHSIAVTDRRVANIVRRCQELPGHELFQYLDDDGAEQGIDSADVNAYVREVTGLDFTAKDFRTWAGTVLTASTLKDLGSFTSVTQAKKNIVSAITEVASQLGNTRSVCKKCYVHPAVLEAYLDESLLPLFQGKLRSSTDGLTDSEQRVLLLLRRRAK